MLTINHGQAKRLSGIVVANDYTFLITKLPVGTKVFVQREKLNSAVDCVSELDYNFSGYFTRAPGTKDEDIIRKYFLVTAVN